MIRRSLATLVVLFIAGSLVVAATTRGVVTKADDKTITIKHRKDPKDKDSETVETVIKVTKDTTYHTQTGTKKDKKVEESSIGKFTEAVEKANKDKGKGQPVTIEHEDGTATKVIFGGGKGGKGKSDKSDKSDK